MKKLIFIFLLGLLTSCSCLLSQIPPQKIYAGTGCSATLPDYRLKITATDNCEISSLTQVPAPGYILNASNKTTSVTVKATDASGNFKQVVFTVTLLDTIKPKLTIDPTLLAYQTEQINDIYTFADNMVKQNMDNLMQQAWIDSIPGLRDKLNLNNFDKQMLIVTSMTKPEGGRSRFIATADSVSYYFKNK